MKESLWFASTFGLTLEFAVFSDKFKYGSNYSSAYQTSPQNKKHNELSEMEKKKIKETFLLWISSVFLGFTAAFCSQSDWGST